MILCLELPAWLLCGFANLFYNFDITMCLMRVQMILRAIATLPYKVLDLLSRNSI